MTQTFWTAVAALGAAAIAPNGISTAGRTKAMGNTRQWTTKFNANNDELKRLLRRKGCTSMSKRKAAMEKAATMSLARSPLIQGEGTK
jgi:hypothetical protein